MRPGELAIGYPTDHARFCQVEGWRQVRDARGCTGTHHVTYELDLRGHQRERAAAGPAHHVTYELDLPDGRTLRTRISHPPDRTDYGPGLWRHILDDQLHVSEAEFWACVRDGTVPARGRPAAPPQALPADLVHLLTTRVGLPEIEVASMSRQEAVARMQRYWTTGA